jgi:hypothetical protein
LLAGASVRERKLHDVTKPIALGTLSFTKFVNSIAIRPSPSSRASMASGLPK